MVFVLRKGVKGAHFVKKRLSKVLAWERVTDVFFLKRVTWVLILG